MIKNDQEYEITKQRVQQYEDAVAAGKADLLRQGYSEEDIKNLTDPGASYFAGLKEEMAEYEQRTGRSSP